MSSGSSLLSLSEAVATLERAADTREVCLGAEGFWRIADEVRPSVEHIADLSDVKPRSPTTNASAALMVLRQWPDDPAFAVELVLTPGAFPCPCCGHLALHDLPGSYDICKVCFWEDDAMQLRWPAYPGGANKPCLIDAQKNYIRLGAMEERFVRHVRPPLDTERLDERWRPIDPEIDVFEHPTQEERDWPDDLTVLYWWRPTFWRPSAPSGDVCDPGS